MATRTRELVRGMRRVPTPAEAKLWARLRGRQLAGAKFRRQHPVGYYVLDFCCVEALLGIEVDGAVHDDPEQQGYDAHREEVLRERGLRILRFTNDEVEKDLDQVVVFISAALAVS